MVRGDDAFAICRDLPRPARHEVGRVLQYELT